MDKKLEQMAQENDSINEIQPIEEEKESSVEKVEVKEETKSAIETSQSLTEDTADKKEEPAKDEEENSEEEKPSEEPKVEVKKEKKQKVKKTKTKKSLIINSIVIGALLCGVGYAAGYFIYQQIKPEQRFEADTGNLRSLETRVANSKTDNLLEVFKDDQYNIINLACVRFAKKKTSLIVSANIADNFSGAQRVTSATINTPTRTFNENISKSDEGAIVNIKTAYRFYDEHKGIVNAYENSEPSDWVEGLEPSKYYTYDEYINAYGKLNQGIYVIDDDKKFLSSNLETEGTLIASPSIYQITSKSVLSCDYTPLEDGKHKFNLVLDSSRSCFYYARQIQTNGGLNKLPSFTDSSKAEFILDENFDLYSCYTVDDYNITLGIEASVHATSFIRYFSSETDELTVNNHKVEIPEINETFPVKINMEGDFI